MPVPLTIEKESRTFTKLKMSGIIVLVQSSRVRLLEVERLKGLEGNGADV